MPTQGTDWDDSIYSGNWEQLGQLDRMSWLASSVGLDPGRLSEPCAILADLTWTLIDGRVMAYVRPK